MKFKVGDRVRVKSIKMTGTVAQIASHADRMVVKLDMPRTSKVTGNWSHYKLAGFDDVEHMEKLPANDEFLELWDQAAEDDDE